MANTVISVENLTKRYDLGVIGTGTLARDLNRWWARLRGKPDPYTRIGQRDHFERIGESILALDDVSFTVEQGEALGIIGKNGAGKSTLLKILSRVTAPTSGIVKVKGRIGSLLEVGTGFHPELTGRENVYLNGAILGMRKDEVDRKFDEIVDFSGVEKFIDTPVKRYSSGMYVRLAFAVAAHLDPEILVVDEVLAVGDAEFQKKCLGKMGDVAGEGRTVLFVSHNMNAVSQLCSKALLIKNGKISFSGQSDETIHKYLINFDDDFHEKSLESYRAKSVKQGVYTEIFIENTLAPCELVVQTKESVEIKLTGISQVNYRNFRTGIHFYSNNNIKLLTYATPWSNLGFVNTSKKFELSCIIPSLPLIPGEYWISIGAGAGGQTIDWLDKICRLIVQPNSNIELDLLPSYKNSGFFLDQSIWEYQDLNN